MIIQRASVASHTEGKSVILTVHTLARSALIMCVQVFVREEMKEEHWQWVQPQQKKIWKVDSPSFYSPCIMREQQMGDFYLTFLSGIPRGIECFRKSRLWRPGKKKKKRQTLSHGPLVLYKPQRWQKPHNSCHMLTSVPRHQHTNTVCSEKNRTGCLNLEIFPIWYETIGVSAL